MLENTFNKQVLQSRIGKTPNCLQPKFKTVIDIEELKRKSEIRFLLTMVFCAMLFFVSFFIHLSYCRIAFWKCINLLVFIKKNYELESLHSIFHIILLHGTIITGLISFVILTKQTHQMNRYKYLMQEKLFGQVLKEKKDLYEFNDLLYKIPIENLYYVEKSLDGKRKINQIEYLTSLNFEKEFEDFKKLCNMLKNTNSIQDQQIILNIYFDSKEKSAKRIHNDEINKQIAKYDLFISDVKKEFGNETAN